MQKWASAHEIQRRESLCFSERACSPRANLHTCKKSLHPKNLSSFIRPRIIFVVLKPYIAFRVASEDLIVANISFCIPQKTKSCRFGTTWVSMMTDISRLVIFPLTLHHVNFTIVFMSRSYMTSL